jgi:hypothetical protein
VSTKVYLASRYDRRRELCGYRDDLARAGYEVNARWLDGTHELKAYETLVGDAGRALIDAPSHDKQADNMRRAFCLEDVQDVMDAHLVISFTESSRSGFPRGGRHVEFGMALATGKGVIVVGHRENLFHFHPSVVFFQTWREALEALHVMKEAGRE